MSLFYLQNYGEVVIENGKVYKRIGQVSGIPNDSSPDTPSISGFTYNYADPQGKTVYSAEERAVSRYLYYYGPFDCPTGYNGTPNVVMASCPVAGILRLSMTASTSHSLYVNDVAVGSRTNMSGEGNSIAANVSVGDKIACQVWDPGRDCIITILPYEFVQSE